MLIVIVVDVDVVARSFNVSMFQLFLLGDFNRFFTVSQLTALVIERLGTLPLSCKVHSGGRLTFFVIRGVLRFLYVAVYACPCLCCACVCISVCVVRAFVCVCASVSACLRASVCVRVLFLCACACLCMPSAPSLRREISLEIA